MSACAAGDSDEARAICLEHIGPEDKPMPRFCLLPEEGQYVTPDRDPTVIVTARTFREISSMVAAQSAYSQSRAASFGDYRAIIHPSRRATLLVVSDMRVLTQRISADAKLRHAALDDIIKRLENRLAPSP